jgi:hypothetical protein
MLQMKKIIRRNYMLPIVWKCLKKDQNCWMKEPEKATKQDDDMDCEEAAVINNNMASCE